MRKHATLDWSLSLLAAMPLMAHAQQAGPVLEERVRAEVQERILSKGVPSVAVAVMRDGKLLMEGAWGRADADKKLEASRATIYPIGSVSKEFTAALVLKLVDRGRVTLTDPIGKYVQGLNPEFSGVTIEQLLNHTSGVPRDVRNPETRFEHKSADDMIRMTAGAKLATQPGTAFGYSNTGYTLLGALAEKVYGKPFGAVLQDEIARPLGLATLTRCGDPTPDQATGYMLSAGKVAPPPGMHHSQLLGAGGICTTAADLVKWRHALHGGRVLSANSYTAMTTPRGAAVSGNYGFGLYVRPAPWGDKAIVGGGQALSGHTAELHWYPGQSLAVALLYNAAPRVPGVADLVPRLVLGVPLADKPK